MLSKSQVFVGFVVNVIYSFSENGLICLAVEQTIMARLAWVKVITSVQQTCDDLRIHKQNFRGLVTVMESLRPSFDLEIDMHNRTLAMGGSHILRTDSSRPIFRI